MKRLGRYIAVGVFAALLGVGGFYALFLEPIALQAQALTADDKTRLQAEYNRLQEEIAQWQKVLDETRAKKNTLQGDVTALDAQIKKAQAEIKQRNVTITGLAVEINRKQEHIAGLESELDQGLASLGKLLREKNQTETASLAVMALSSGSISDFLSVVDAVDSINAKLQARFEELRTVKTETQKEKEALDDRRNRELDARYEVQVKQKQIQENQTEKKQLLTITKQEEASYGLVLAERQRRAETIRSALFDLRDTQGISFATALDYSSFASEKTGVRAALILAILSQESDLGKNIGSCFVSSLETGDGVGKNTGAVFERVMKAPRDTEPFEEITRAVGLNWATTPVSCPLGKIY